MASRFDGTGVVKLQTSEGVFTSLKLAQLPWPDEMGEVVNGYRQFVRPKQGIGTDGVRYRVIWPELSNGPGSKPRSSSFTLSRAHVNETLYVLAEFLRDQGVEFVALANKHGNAFSDVGLSGSSLAYLARDVPHSPACHVDFGLTDTPELSGASGGLLHDAALNR
jgi:hypothetical protein